MAVSCVAVLRVALLILKECQPERIIGNEYSIRADVWSAGLSILELVQNRFPFPENLSHIELIFHISQSEVDTLMVSS